MKRVVSWLILIILIAGLCWYTIDLSSPTQSEIDSFKTEVEPVTKNIVDEEVLTDLQELVSHGKLPVTVSDSEIGKTSPFE